MSKSYVARSQRKDKGAKLGRFLILLSLLGLMDLAPGAMAHAAPGLDETITTYDMWVRRGDATVCVGGTSSIAVEVRQHTEVMDANGDIVAELDHRDAAATIEGSVRDPDVGTLEPASVQVATDVNYGGLGQAIFTFHGNKAGSTTVHFETTVADRLSDKSITMTVEDCKYEVSMVAFSVSVGGGVNIWTVGRLLTQIAPENGEYKGSGSVKFTSGFGSDVCAINYSLYQAPTTITGPLVQNNELSLNFKFEPASLTSQVTCPDFGGSGSHTVDLTNLNMPSVEFPAEGGTVVLKLQYAGSDAGDSTVIITVRRIQP